MYTVCSGCFSLSRERSVVRQLRHVGSTRAYSLYTKYDVKPIPIPSRQKKLVALTENINKNHTINCHKNGLALILIHNKLCSIIYAGETV